MALGKLDGKMGSLGSLGGTKKTPEVPTQTAEEEAQEEMSEALSVFRDAAKRERDRFVTATSPDYWCGIYFETKEQRDEFLAALKALDILEAQWINGRKLAERLGIVLKSPRLPRRSFKIDPKWSDLSL